MPRWEYAQLSYMDGHFDPTEAVGTDLEAAGASQDEGWVSFTHGEHGLLFAKDDLLGRIRQLGDDGWEMVSVDHEKYGDPGIKTEVRLTSYWFKRERT